MSASAREKQHGRNAWSARIWFSAGAFVLAGGCTLIRDIDDFSFRDGGVDAQIDARPDARQRPDTRPETCEEACAGNANVLETRCEEEECVIDACQSGFVDCDGEPSNGCESTPSACDAFVEVAVAHEHVCARRESGAVDCWGSNEGAVFDDTFLPAGAPTRLMIRVPESDEMREVNAKSISVGIDHTCFVSAAEDTDGMLFCVGAPGSIRVGHREVQDGEPHAVVDGGGPLRERFTRIVSHSLHSCAIDTIGRLWCFGDNRFGQAFLGRNSPDSVVATQNSLVVDDTPATFVDVAVGQDHTCVVLGDRTLRCWGRDDVGQTGRGIPTVGAPAEPSPVFHAEGEVTDVSRVYASKDESCALTNTSELWCWGFNRHESIDAPGVQAAAVRMATGVTSVMMFMQSICWAVDGETVCRGLREDGQLGSGSREDILEDFTAPTAVPELQGLRDVAGGRYGGCGFRGDQLFCWGYSTQGQVPRASLVQRSPAPLVDSTGAAVNNLGTVVPSLNGTCGVADERASCWGFGGASQSGYAESSASSSTPRNVPLISNVIAVARGDNGACAVSGAPAELWCWGWNTTGIIATENTQVPTVVELGRPPLGPIDMGSGHTCALLDDGGETEVWCWGLNSRGQADGSPGDPTEPARLNLGDSIAPVDVTTGRDFSCALADDGQAFCWGDNRVGQLGREEPAPRPEAVTSARFARIDAGARHACGVSQDGAALCWGDNSGDQLGSNATGPFVARPTEVDVPGTILSVSAGVSSSCAANSIGEVYCWGDNSLGQLGSLGPSSREPRRVEDIIATEVVSGSSIGAHCAGRGGSWWCWGFDAYGQLGTQANLRFPPTLIPSE